VTVDKIAWIVGLKLGVMHESQDEWVKKILGKDRIRRVYRARNLVCLVLHEFCGVSYNEIAHLLSDRQPSSVGRALVHARAWVQESTDNEAIWIDICNAVKDSIAAEQEHHARSNNIKVGFSD
jgi:chromosomal replication initiation ATPase DnaA